MKFSKELEWLGPYILDVMPLVPNIKKLESVRKIALKRGSIGRIHGVTHVLTGGSYNILLYTHYNKVSAQTPKLRLSRKPYTKIDILITLAHELAHLQFWEHCPRRQILESQITIQFMIRLKNEGYTSEERE